ncbi:EamA family transporter [Solemya velesiana gill symbiont]|uniref:EamA domain-containing protein n=1 Tax=Solemya velesiana gill symbiont TaxID=1918948 RepID=A0A1T2KV19_9GAMM|nr:EamA family transporter [Solemya velesiana gill symbiont]OOZ36566.1 hypothetical protein BOW51_06620 [Solemya velesiana gill symbiont]
MPPTSQHTTGAFIVALGVLILSFDALLIRLVNAPEWDVVFWRGLLMAFTLFLAIAIQNKNSMRLFLSFGWPALFTALIQGVGSALFVLAVNHTSVANTVVLIATAPLFAAMALGGNLTLLRRYHEMPRMPVVAVSGLITAALAIPLSNPLELSTQSYAWLALMGMVQMPAALVMITLGTRYLTSPEVSLFILLETLFGPIWVWLVLGETVSPETLGGGMIIVGTLAIYSWLNIQQARFVSIQKM